MLLSLPHRYQPVWQLLSRETDEAIVGYLQRQFFAADKFSLFTYYTKIDIMLY